MTRAEQIRNAVFEMTGPFTGEDVCNKLYFTEKKEKDSLLQELNKMCLQHDLLDLVEGDKMWSLKTVYKNKKEVKKEDPPKPVDPPQADPADVVTKLSNKEITRFIADEGMTEVFRENDQLKAEIESMREKVKEANEVARSERSNLKDTKELRGKLDELITERHDLVQREVELCRTIRSLKDKLLKADEEITSLRKQVSELARFNKTK